MNLMLRAFGQSEKLTLKERANLILGLHQKVSVLLGQFEWKINTKEEKYININEFENSYPYILKSVKSGLNSKVVNPIKYKENDIADITSRCLFSNNSYKDPKFSYSVGFPSKSGFPSLSIGIENIRDYNIFSKEILYNLSILFIKSWKPEFLCVTDKDFFHDISKAHEGKIPWTGWFTYLSNDFLNYDKKNNLFEKLMKFRKINLDSLGLFKIENIEEFGTIYWTCEEYFDPKNPKHVETALRLEDYFKSENYSLNVIHKSIPNNIKEL